MTLTQINKAGLDELALDHVFTIGASGTDHYTFQGEGLNGTVNDPTLYLTRGKTYRFENGTGAHPIRIQSTSGASGTAYNTGVTNNAGSGTVIVEVQHDAPDVLYYQCTSHANMNGVLYITGALADGGVTTAKLAADAVDGTKIADNAVAAEHIAANAVGSSELASNAVARANIQDAEVIGSKIAANAITTDKISNGTIQSEDIADNQIITTKILDTAVTLAKLPHGTVSNDGKFLRANNGADPSFETITGTTINNNADNRVITGSGTANTLNGESGLTFNGTNTFGLDAGANGAPTIQLQHSGSGNDVFQITSGIAGVSNGGFGIRDVDESAYRLVIDSSGNVGINTTSSHGKLQVHDGSIVHSKPAGGGTRNYKFVNNNTAAGDYGIQISTTEAGTTYVNHTELKAGGDVHIHDGNLVVASSHGINFHNYGTGTNISSNLLDDYEEGSWTPGFYPQSSAMTLNYDLRTGSYVKIGRVVYWQFRMRLSSLSGNGNQVLGLSGLPYTTDSGQPQVSASIWGYSWSGEVPTAVFYHGGTTRAEFYYYTSSNTWNASSALDLNGNSSYTAGSGFYFIA